MTVLEKGKFIKNFCRVDKDGTLVKPRPSNFRYYIKKDIEVLESQVDNNYWSAWETFLKDQKSNKELQNQYVDWAHYLYALNTIDKEDIEKYNLPKEFIIVDYMW